MIVIDPKLKNHEGFLKRVFEIAIDQRKYFFRKAETITQMERLIFKNVLKDEIQSKDLLSKAIFQTVMRNYKWNLKKFFKAANSPNVDLWTGKDIIHIDKDLEPDKMLMGINGHRVREYYKRYYFNDDKESLEAYEIPPLKTRVETAIKNVMGYIHENDLYIPLHEDYKCKMSKDLD